ncbi:hypothetical protein P7K49_013214 [Saguinus oedipus]|uniref:Uncharacterized protein n=1 Tax=Saguinus oedipus TaxID=9490 RepID=A0ABQ9VFA6_SAGOE|nr:hypothetical protein P7K49_013214 [Saguinus oedipus]
MIRPSVYRNVARQLHISLQSEPVVTDAFLAVAGHIFSAGMPSLPIPWDLREGSGAHRDLTSQPLPILVLPSAHWCHLAAVDVWNCPATSADPQDSNHSIQGLSWFCGLAGTLGSRPRLLESCNCV